MSRRRPQRSPLARPLGNWATIRDRIDDTHYMISIGSRVSMGVVAFYSGARVLRKGERVLATWREESHLWHIQGVGKPTISASGEPAANTDDGDWWRGVGGLDATSATFGVQRTLGSVYFDGWLRLPAITITQGTVAASAVLNLVQISRSFGGKTNRVKGNAVDDAVSPVDQVDGDAKVRTTAAETFLTLNIDGPFTINVTDIVNEIFARGGWSSGNALMFLFDAITNNNSVGWAAFDSGVNFATLEINLRGEAPTEQLSSTDLSDFEEV